MPSGGTNYRAAGRPPGSGLTLAVESSLKASPNPPLRVGFPRGLESKGQVRHLSFVSARPHPRLGDAVRRYLDLNKPAGLLTVRVGSSSLRRFR
jgi:hypothetical protein